MMFSLQETKKSAQIIESLAQQRASYDQEAGVALRSNDHQKQATALANLDRVWNQMQTLSKDVYRRPPHVLSETDLEVYYAKLRPYDHFYPNGIFFGDLGIVHLKPGDEGQKVTCEEAKQLLPKTPEEEEERSQFALTPKASLTESYVYVKTPVAPIDNIDHQFINEKGQSFEKMELYGLHTYGGYHQFFRPDLREVIHLLNEHINLTELQNVDRIYVTTDPHPTDSIYDNFDRKQDMHRGRTTAFIVWKAKHKGRKRLATTGSSEQKKKKTKV